MHFGHVKPNNRPTQANWTPILDFATLKQTPPTCSKAMFNWINDFHIYYHTLNTMNVTSQFHIWFLKD